MHNLESMSQYESIQLVGIPVIAMWDKDLDEWMLKNTTTGKSQGGYKYFPCPLEVEKFVKGLSTAVNQYNNLYMNGG